jgi:hypothetical protein
METIDNPSSSYQPISVKDWIITILITAIPLVGLIMLFVWGFGSDTHPSKANWAKATLIWYLIGIVISMIIISVVGTAAFFGAAANGM